jgi:hypothetical protein
VKVNPVLLQKTDLLSNRNSGAKRRARLPWAHTTRLQQLHPLLLTNNVSNKSGNPNPLPLAAINHSAIAFRGGQAINLAIAETPKEDR